MRKPQPDPARPRRRRVTTLIKTLLSVAPKLLDPLPTQPAPDDLEGWKTYWKDHGQPWRTEPEIDARRQAELAKRRAIVPDIEKGIYPFSSMKLTRADVEWLLATHEHGRGPIDWSDESQREREGLDLRGADLRRSDNQRTNLTGLPLARLIGGLSFEEKQVMNLCSMKEQLKLARVMLTKVDLSGADLQGACLGNAQLQGADLRETQLQGADLSGARLQKADFYKAQIQKADLSGAKLQGAYFRRAQLQGASLGDAQLQGANLGHAQLQRAYLGDAQLQGVDLHDANLWEAHLYRVQLQKANLFNADLQGSHLHEAQLQGADLCRADLRDVNLREAQLQGASLREVYFADSQGIGPQLVNARWDGINLTVVDWSRIKILGDEYTARQKKDERGCVKYKETRLDEHREAVRANRQLATALQSQGLNEDAARFAYRANLLQRKVLWFQMIQHRIPLGQRVQKFGAWAFSHLLNLLAGYGYRPERSFLAYLLIVFGFMGFYLLTGQFVAPHLSWDEALVLSLSSFHGRGFFTQTLTLGDPYARLAVTEAVMGLFVEVSLIATFTQRFFGK